MVYVYSHHIVNLPATVLLNSPLCPPQYFLADTIIVFLPFQCDYAADYCIIRMSPLQYLSYIHGDRRIPACRLPTGSGLQLSAGMAVA